MTNSRSVTVSAPSRLHFGLLSFGRTDGRQFGGVGVMIRQPALRLKITAADHLKAIGPMCERAESIARRVYATGLLPDYPACVIEILASPDAHVGLGSGTQLALSVAAGLFALHNLPRPPLDALAGATGRGVRSAVGAYGFAEGGLIAEAGKLADDVLAPRIAREEFPPAWRFVLIRPNCGAGPSGAVERQAFERLPPMPLETTDQLCRELTLHLLPAIRQARFNEFSESLYRYGYTSGASFAPVQGGPFASPRLAQLVADLRSAGVKGVGQSSWGPTLFALLPDQQSADDLVRQMQQRADAEDLRLTVTAADNRGGMVRFEA